MNHFTSTDRVGHEGHVTKVEALEQRRQIIGKRVVVIAVPGPVGATVTPSVVGDAPKSPSCEVRNLELPHP